MSDARPADANRDVLQRTLYERARIRTGKDVVLQLVADGAPIVDAVTSGLLLEQQP